MAKRKQDASADNAGESVQEALADNFNPDADVPPEMQEVEKARVKRPDPFGFDAIRWPDGYTIRLMESDANREIFIQFGSGSKDDQPKNFEAIKKILKDDHKMYWDVKVMGWAKGLRFGITPLVREDNKRTRAQVEDAFCKAVALEEEKRGPSLTEYARERSAPIR